MEQKRILVALLLLLALAPTTSAVARQRATKDASTSQFSFDTLECGKTKGCYLAPPNCINEQCDSFLSWADEGDQVFFEFSKVIDPEVGANQWVGFGLSNDDSMADVSFAACLYNGSSRIISSYNFRRSNLVFDDPLLGFEPSSLSITYRSDRIDCSLKREKNIDSNLPDADKFFNLANASYYYQIGSGPVKTTGGIGKHIVTPITTSTKINTSSIEIVGGFNVSPLLKAHACLMIAAWVLLSGVGMLVARYYKGAWELEISKIKFWFWVHRTSMQLVLLLTAAGFIIVFFYVDGFTEMVGTGVSDLQRSHPIIGIIVMLLTLINPVMAFFRPGPGTQSRMIFNLVHRLVGESGRILAVVNIIIGFYLPKSQLFTDMWMVWVTVGLVVFHFLVEIILYFFTFTLNSETTASKSDSYTLGDSGVELIDKTKERSYSLQTGMLFVYAIVMFGFSIAIFVEIGIK